MWDPGTSMCGEERAGILLSPQFPPWSEGRFKVGSGRVRDAVTQKPLLEISSSTSLLAFLPLN